MHKKKSLRVLGAFLLFTYVFVPFAVQADIYIKQKNHTDEVNIMGQIQPAKDEIFVTWMGKDKARLDYSEDTSIIVRPDKKMMYTIDHAKMTYFEMPFNETSDILTASISGADLSGEEKAQAQKMMKGFAQMMTPEVSVTETGETQKIKNWKCKKYIMTMKMMGTTSTSEIWATTDIKINYELFTTLRLSMMPKTPGLDMMLEEMKKIKGLAVLSTETTAMMGTQVQSTQELLEASEKSAPARTYEVPEGYKKANK
ncbi:MAG: hypothetical protein GF421_02570 [Candidatus Aminicenantes bacterium]|nr:hypothetical protein [Candidatus Aminicenantes bacterium]